MKNRRFDPARGGGSSSRGSREASTAADAKGKSLRAAEGRKKGTKKKKNRSSDPVPESDGVDVAGGEIAKPKQLRKQRRSASPVSDTDASPGEVSAPPVRDKKSRLSYKRRKKNNRIRNSSLLFADLQDLAEEDAQAVGQASAAPSGREVNMPMMLKGSYHPLLGKAKQQILLQDDPPTNRPRSEEAKKSSAVVTSSTSPLEIKPDIHSPPRSPRSVDSWNIAGSNSEQLEKILNVIDHEQEEGPEEIEGLDWDDTKLIKEIDNYLNQFTYDLPPKDDENFWYYNDREQLKRLKEQVALHRIKAHRISKGAKLEELKDAELIKEYPSEVLEDEGYYKHYEQDFEWYFDPEYIVNAGFQDYQRLVLRDDGHYLEYDYYRETLCTHEGDRGFVEFCEKLSSRTKWIVKFLEVDKSEWKRYELVAFYHAVKIAAGYHEIFLRLIYLGFQEYLWSIRFDNWTRKDIAIVYFEIWKRVTKGKMDFIGALEQVYELDIGVPCRSDIKRELGYRPGSGVLKHNYETYLVDIGEEVQEDAALSMIMEAVKAFVPKQKMYYDYAKMKLDIARENGIIPPKDCLSTIQIDNKEGGTTAANPKKQEAH